MNKYDINKFLKKNSSTILTIVGSVGVGITAIMSAKDTVKAIKRLERTREIKLRPLDTKEKIKVVVPCYIPTVLTGVSTILCVCGAHKLNKNAQESLASAYMLLDQSYKEYRNSVKEVFGEDSDKNVIKHIAGNKTEELDLKNPEEGDVFFDFFSMRFFNSSVSAIRDAERAINEMLQMHGYISLGTVYSFLGAEVQPSDESLGWSIGAGRLYGYDSIKIDIDEGVGKDGLKYYVIDFMDSPTEDYLEL